MRGVNKGRGRASVLASASTRSTPHFPNSTTFTISGSSPASRLISCDVIPKSRSRCHRGSNPTDDFRLLHCHEYKVQVA